MKRWSIAAIVVVVLFTAILGTVIALELVWNNWVLMKLLNCSIILVVNVALMALYLFVTQALGRKIVEWPIDGISQELKQVKL